MTDDRRYRLVMEFDDGRYEEHGGLTMSDVAGELALVATKRTSSLGEGLDPMRKAWIEPMEIETAEQRTQRARDFSIDHPGSDEG